MVTRQLMGTGVAALVLLAAGCGGGAAKETAARADAAAAEYRAALKDWSGELRAAAGTMRKLPSPAPRLASVKGTSEAYAATQRIAARADAVANELQLVLTAGRSERAARLYYRLYGVANDLWREDFDANDRAFERNVASDDRIFGSGSQDPADNRRLTEASNRSFGRYGKDVAKAFRRAAQRLERQRPATGLERSTIAFQAAEYRGSVAAAQRLVAQTRRWPSLPVGSVESGLVAKQPVYPIAFDAPVRNRKPLVRGFVEALAGLAATDAVTADTPSVGDAYRAVVVRGLGKPRDPKSGPPKAVTQRLWMLRRIQELERTPDADYQDARQTLLGWSVGDPRSAYAKLLKSVTEMQYLGYQYRPVGVRERHAHIRWIAEALSGPVAPSLSPVRTQYLGVLAGWTDGDDFDDIDQRAADGRRIVRIVRRYTRRLDDVPAQRRALRRAVAATRPAATRSGSQ